MKSKTIFNKIGSFLREAVYELKKVIWPNKNELKNSTMTVIFTVIIISVFVGFVDLIFTKILTLFM
ncbi:MAG: preprotein translocase subunit SecE [Candidatus Caldatribacteriota bacterium]|nr:preprotein translocase subunit SecE [Candidatus Caldatribacteriota bacterium]